MANQLGQSYSVTLQTLTPVHIGVSQEHWWQNGIDFFQDGEFLHVVRLDDLFSQSHLNIEDIDKVTASINNGGAKGLADYFVKQRGLNLKEIAIRSFKFKDVHMSELRPMISTAQGQPMVPSSSIKGVFRTAFLREQILRAPDYVRSQHNLGRETYKGFRFSDRRLQENYIGKDPKQDPFRFVRFSDFYFQGNETQCAKVQIMNYQGGHKSQWGFKPGQFTHVECLMPDLKATGKLAIPHAIAAKAAQYGGVKHTEWLTPAKLCKMVNATTLALLHEEMMFWQDEDEYPDAVADYLETLKEVEETAKACGEKACVLRLGSGSGWDFMTGAWIKEQGTVTDDTWDLFKASMRRRGYEDMVFPKSRKLTHRHEPFGFAKVAME